MVVIAHLLRLRTYQLCSYASPSCYPVQHLRWKWPNCQQGHYGWSTTNRPPVSSSWPRQPIVTYFQVNLWERYLRTHFVTTEGLHLRRSLGQWTRDSNFEWRYTRSPTDVIDMTLRLQAIAVRSSRPSTTFSVWRPASRITT